MSKADEIEEAKKILKDMNDGFTFQYCQVCINDNKYDEKEGICKSKTCEYLKAIKLVLKALEDKDKEIEKEHKTAVKYSKEAQKYFDAMMDNERIIDEIDIQNKIIDKMTECILEDTLKLNTFWCAGCLEYVNCKYKRIEECIKEYFRKKVENE